MRTNHTNRKTRKTHASRRTTPPHRPAPPPAFAPAWICRHVAAARRSYTSLSLFLEAVARDSFFPLFPLISEEWRARNISYKLATCFGETKTEIWNNDVCWTRILTKDLTNAQRNSENTQFDAIRTSSDEHEAGPFGSENAHVGQDSQHFRLVLQLYCYRTTSANIEVKMESRTEIASKHLAHASSSELRSCIVVSGVLRVKKC